MFVSGQLFGRKKVKNDKQTNKNKVYRALSVCWLQVVYRLNNSTCTASMWCNVQVFLLWQWIKKVHCGKNGTNILMRRNQTSIFHFLKILFQLHGWKNVHYLFYIMPRLRARLPCDAHKLMEPKINGEWSKMHGLWHRSLKKIWLGQIFNFMWPTIQSNYKDLFRLCIILTVWCISICRSTSYDRSWYWTPGCANTIRPLEESIHFLISSAGLLLHTFYPFPFFHHIKPSHMCLKLHECQKSLKTLCYIKTQCRHMKSRI